MKAISVFCGSSTGNDPEFTNSAQELGKYLAENKITLVYGGSSVGIMGIVADSVLSHGGKVVGVLPRFLANKEISHSGLTELILCETMHERKTKMFELSEGFIALPGGFGTLEEVVEILTWRQLGFHSFPVAFLNISGFYDPLIAQFGNMEQSKLLKSEHRNMVLFDRTVEGVFKQMKNLQPSFAEKWIGSRQT